MSLLRAKFIKTENKIQCRMGGGGGKSALKTVHYMYTVHTCIPRQLIKIFFLSVQLKIT